MFIFSPRKFVSSTLKIHPEFDHFSSVFLWLSPSLGILISAFWLASIDQAQLSWLQSDHGLCSNSPMASLLNKLKPKSLQWFSRSTWSSHTQLSNPTSYSTHPSPCSTTSASSMFLEYAKHVSALEKGLETRSLRFQMLFLNLNNLYRDSPEIRIRIFS